MLEMSKCELIPNCKVISAKYKYLVNADARPVKNAILPTSFRNTADSVSIYRVGIGNKKAHPSTQADLCTWIHMNPPYNEKKKAVKRKKAKK